MNNHRILSRHPNGGRGGGGATTTVTTSNNKKPTTTTRIKFRTLSQPVRLAAGLALAAVFAIVLNANLLSYHSSSQERVSTSGGIGTVVMVANETVAAVADAAASKQQAAREEKVGAIKQPQQQQQQQPAQDTNDTATTSLLSSVLLPPPAEYLKRGISIADIYSFPERARINDKQCSCRNPHANSTKCCRRLFRRVHKMGYILTLHLFDEYKDPAPITLYGIQPLAMDYLKIKPTGDFRDVLLVRSIYDSLVSGYLYHKDGRECYKDPWGNPSDKHHFALVRSWKKHLSFEVAEAKRKMIFCNYLLREPEEEGMRAYIEWAFRAHYRVFLSAWALSQGLPYVAERTLVVCYEDLASEDSNRSNATMTTILDFFYNGTNHKPWNGYAPGQNNSDAGGHATSADPDVRMRLVKIIKRLDHTYYNGDIAWLDSMLPC